MNSLPKIQAWFRTRVGQLVTDGVLCGCVLSAFCAYLGMHTLGIGWLEDILRAYQNGIPMKMPPDIEARAKQVLEECDLRQKEKDLIRFFLTSKIQPTHVGGTKLNTGALVGIPLYFKYRVLSDIERRSLTIPRTSEVQWSSDAGMELQESLLLSEDAQKFVIAREIYHAKQYYVYYTCFLTSGSMMLSMALSKTLNDKLGLFRRPLSLRLALYAASCALGAGVFVAAKDALNIRFNNKTDQMAAAMGPRYLEGGIEYYSKQLKHNQALRTLMGKYGESAYTSQGNYSNWFRSPNYNPSARLDRLKEMLLTSTSSSSFAEDVNEA